MPAVRPKFLCAMLAGRCPTWLRQAPPALRPTTTCSPSATIRSTPTPPMRSPPRRRRMADGQQAAFRSLLKRLVPVTAYDRLKRLSALKASGFLDGVTVRSERNSSTDYIASLDFSFRADSVRTCCAGRHPLHRRAGARRHHRAGRAQCRRGGRHRRRRPRLDGCVEEPRPRAHADAVQPANAEEPDPHRHIEDGRRGPRRR